MTEAGPDDACDGINKRRGFAVADRPKRSTHIGRRLGFEAKQALTRSGPGAGSKQAIFLSI